MIPSASTGVTSVNGARLFYEVAGEGIPLVLNHAGLASCRMWDDQFEVFAQHYRVIRWDFRGYGKSPIVPGSFSGHADLQGLLRALGVGRAHVLGLSLGGRIAIDFALEYPDMVAGLILVASGLGGYQFTQIPLMAEITDAIAQGDVARAVELELRLWVDGPNRTPDQVAPTVREKVRQMNTDAFATLTKAGTYQPLNPPAVGRLGAIRVPTMVVVGDQDVPDILTIADRLTTEIPQAKKLVLRGVAHMVNLERPQEFNRVVLEFLASLPQR